MDQTNVIMPILKLQEDIILPFENLAIPEYEKLVGYKFIVLTFCEKDITKFKTIGVVCEVLGKTGGIIASNLGTQNYSKLNLIGRNRCSLVNPDKFTEKEIKAKIFNWKVNKVEDQGKFFI